MEICEPRIELDHRWPSPKTLAQVRPRTKRLQNCLDALDERRHRGSIGLPGEMHTEHVLLIGGTEPEFVGGDSTDLRAPDDGCDGVPEPAQRVDR